MKISHDLFEKIISPQNLFEAWDEFKIGKRDKPDVQRFERHLEDNVFVLYEELKNKTYKHSPYKSFYIRDPKTRHIHKATVRDRIVHHALFRHIALIFDKTFIADSYSCRIDKGVHKAIERFRAFGNKVTWNNTRNAFVLKCDIKKFFATIDHAILKSLISQRIKDQDTLWLLDRIIDSFDSEKSRKPDHRKGSPIGNLTSQLFANIYLNELDQFVKHDLKIKYYIRYTDDYIFLHEDKSVLEGILKPVQDFLDITLEAELHPDKIILRKYQQGIDFLGYITLPYVRLPRSRTKRRVFYKLREKVKEAKQKNIDITTVDASLQSYLGFLKHTDSYKLKENLKQKLWEWIVSL